MLRTRTDVAANTSLHRPPRVSRSPYCAKPIENAAVIFHLVGEKGNMELKTNEDGKAVIDVLPLGGNVRLQIIAKGFQTYGEDFKIDKAELAIGVKMKRPGEQYSIYPSRGNAADAGKDAAPAPAPPRNRTPSPASLSQSRFVVSHLRRDQAASKVGYPAEFTSAGLLIRL